MLNFAYLKKKIVLITGGTGTFGRAFVKKLLQDSKAAKIIIYSRDEFKQHEMRQELSDPDNRLRFFLGDVRDLQRLERAFQDVDIVMHAAALKQVPAIEYNPFEGIKTNIIGTQNVIEAALNKQVGKVLFVSSDKAVQPVNLYGATKLAAEKLCIAANSYGSGSRGRVRLSVIRYGNVEGSRGSLLDVISRQRPTGVVTLTHPDMTRFWIAVDLVMDFVLKALKDMRGGEIFVPKMHSIRIVDVLKTAVPECRVKMIGIRPGEKIHESLISSAEVGRTKDIGYAYMIVPEYVSGYPRGDKRAKLQYEHGESVSEHFEYTSAHPDILLSGKEAKRVITFGRGRLQI